MILPAPSTTRLLAASGVNLVRREWLTAPILLLVIVGLTLRGGRPGASVPPGRRRLANSLLAVGALLLAVYVVSWFV